MVRTNFKSTEVGLIPIDWEVSKLLDKCILLNGLTYTPANIQEHGVLVLRSSNVQNGKLCFDDNVYVDCHISDEKFVRKNDIIVCVRNGSSALIGKCAIATEDLHATFGAFMALLRGDDNKFIFQLLQEGSIQKKLKNNSGATINQITKKDFESVFIPAPPSDEQKAIAIALSDVDELIENLEKLIEKKKAIKQGIMQDLLSGKRRLPGFSKEWETIELGRIALDMADGPFGSNLKVEHYTEAQEVRIVQLSNIGDDGWKDENKKYTTFQHAKEISRSIVNPGDVIIAKMMPAGRAILCPSNDPGYVLSSDAVKLVINEDKAIPAFVVYATKSSHFQQQISDQIQGSTRARTSITKLRKNTIRLPSIEEQREIVRILSDIDEEIESLLVKMSKYCHIKQGMMQKLLTGEIRLM